MFIAIRSFFTEDVWKDRLDALTPLRAAAVRCLRVLLLAVTGFERDGVPLHAAALTFYSLLSLVPVIALAIGIARGFGLDRLFVEQIAERFAFQPGVAGYIIRFVRAFLEQTRTGIVAGAGVAVLFWSVISALSNIEQALNGIWGIPAGRGLTRKFSDYLSMVLVGTLLLIVASSLTVVVSTEARILLSRFGLAGAARPLLLFLLEFLSYLSIWLLFSFMYYFMPNTKIAPAAALTGGVVAGTAYQLLQWIYIHFQVNVASYSAVYGSVAALPLFIAWVQLSWNIFLFGAEIAHAGENAETFGFTPGHVQLTVHARNAVLVRIMLALTRRFIAGEPPARVRTLSRQLELPQQLVQDDLRLLVSAGLVSTTPDRDTGGMAYQPAKDPDALTVITVLNAVREQGRELPENRSADAGEVSAALGELQEAERLSPGNAALKDL